MGTFSRYRLLVMRNRRLDFLFFSEEKRAHDDKNKNARKQHYEQKLTGRSSNSRPAGIQRCFTASRCATLAWRKFIVTIVSTHAYFPCIAA